jgi:hypothetical protein
LGKDFWDEESFKTNLETVGVASSAELANNGSAKVFRVEAEVSRG